MNSERQDEAPAKRLDRLVAQLYGFHVGYLDFRGRHKTRYVTLLHRWKRLSKDFLDVLQASGSIPEEGHKAEGRADAPMPAFKAWTQFIEKWHIPPHIPPPLISEKICRTLNLLQNGSDPIFQKLCLEHLPVELLREIFEHLDPAAVLKVASSSRLLRAVGQPFTFRIRHIQLRFVPRYLTAEDESFPKKKWLKLKKELSEQVNYIHKHPELANEVQVMYVADRWRHQREAAWSHRTALITLHKELSPSVTSSFALAISSAPRITTLNLSYIDINLKMAEAIVQLRVLQSLDLFHCNLVDGASDFLLRGEFTCPTTTHLRLTFDQVPSLSMYNTLPLFPNLRTLIIGSLKQAHSPVTPPPESLWNNIQFFSTLERLALNYIPWYSVAGFASWFASNAPFPRLTHLKVHSRLGMDDADIIELLSTLEQSPLQTLILDGLADGSLFLFDVIASKLPNLLGLTLYRRHSDRQANTTLAEWPRRTYEYAERLAGFTKLQHFAWNCIVGYECEYTPKSLRRLEEGKLLPPASLFDPEPLDDHTMDEDHLLALPFASACPTLETFAISSHPYTSAVFCRIRRFPEKGGMVIESERPFCGIPDRRWDVMASDGNLGWTEV